MCTSNGWQEIYAINYSMVFLFFLDISRLWRRVQDSILSSTFLSFDHRVFHLFSFSTGLNSIYLNQSWTSGSHETRKKNQTKMREWMRARELELWTIWFWGGVKIYRRARGATKKLNAFDWSPSFSYLMCYVRSWLVRFRPQIAFSVYS